MSKAPRPIRIEGDIAYIPLTRGHVAVIDAADVPLVSAWSWTAKVVRRKDGSVRNVYAVRCETTAPGVHRMRCMHLYLHATSEIREVDHIDGDGLNNRRSNLRPATKSQNAFNRKTPVHNTSGFKGVSWDSRRNKWLACINTNGRRHRLGAFQCATAAAIAYAKASRDLHGEFGRVA